MGSTMRSLSMRNAAKQNSAPEVGNIVTTDSSDAISTDLVAPIAQLVDFDLTTADAPIEHVDVAAATDALTEIFSDPVIDVSEQVPVDLTSASQDVVVSADVVDQKKSKPKPPVKKSNKTSSQKKVNP